ncbi:hypothetical protein GGR56DRAFT_92254 [Xylariaceae sp. FL0804]|nr:hypothetical protein GGR56DRAFT_92254 [Xylariaceae sp. FL0804]
MVLVYLQGNGIFPRSQTTCCSIEPGWLAGWLTAPLVLVCQDVLLSAVVALHGHNSKPMAQEHFPSRSSLSIKNRYSLLKRRRRRHAAGTQPQPQQVAPVPRVPGEPPAVLVAPVPGSQAPHDADIATAAFGLAAGSSSTMRTGSSARDGASDLLPERLVRAQQPRLERLFPVRHYRCQLGGEAQLSIRLLEYAANQHRVRGPYCRARVEQSLHLVGSLGRRPAPRRRGRRGDV